MKKLFPLLIAAFLAVCLSSCGSTTKAIIRNGADGTQTSVTITTNNPTTWQVDPNVVLDQKQKSN